MAKPIWCFSEMFSLTSGTRSAALKKQGRSLPDVIAAKPSARYDEVWGKLFQSRSDFVALVYPGCLGASGA